MVTLGEHLRHVRKQQGTTLATVSARTELATSYVSELERGTAANPTIETLWRLANAYGLTVIGLLRNVDGYGEPLLSGLSRDEFTKVQEYVAFMRWRRATTTIHPNGTEGENG